MISALRSEPSPLIAGRRRAPVRVLIVDDSAVARTVLTRMLNERGGFDVVAQASGADEALNLLGQLQVDVILLDLEMPGVGGLVALPDLIAAGRGARVLIVSSACAEGAASTMQALRLGAADTMLKPGAVAFAGRFAEELAERMHRIVAPGADEEAPATAHHAETRTDLARIECIGIGASTGGVHALETFFHALPAHVTVPILITQHLPAPFMPYFVPQLTDISGRTVRLAEPGLRPIPGEIMLAPGDGSITLTRSGAQVHVRLERRRSPSGCLPSVDPMLASIGEIYGPGAIGVILSGMGRDGAEGAAVLAGKGGVVIAQDRASSVVWGMPGVVTKAGLAEMVATPDALARAIGERVQGEVSAWR